MNRCRILLAALLFVAGAGRIAVAQAAAKPEVDADAIAALEKMGGYLRSLKAFQVTAETTRDEVLVDGQKVTFSGKVDVLAVPPSFSRTEIDSDRQKRTYFYDGKTFTIWAPRVS